MLTLMEQKDSIVLKILDELKLDTETVRQKISETVMDSTRKIPDISYDEGATVAMKVSREVQLLFERADHERSRLGDSYVSTAAMFMEACCTCSLSPRVALTVSALTSGGSSFLLLLSCLCTTRMEQRYAGRSQSQIISHTEG